jgi:hypothetical protein
MLFFSLLFPYFVLVNFLDSRISLIILLSVSFLAVAGRFTRVLLLLDRTVLRRVL